jgi:hypothetical protein
MNSFILAYAAIAIAIIIGWVMNLVQLIGMASDGVTGLFVLKIVGLFLAPLGAVLGYIGT